MLLGEMGITFFLTNELLRASEMSPSRPAVSSSLFLMVGPLEGCVSCFSWPQMPSMSWYAVPSRKQPDQDGSPLYSLEFYLFSIFGRSQVGQERWEREGSMQIIRCRNPGQIHPPLYWLIPCEGIGTNWPTIDGNIYPRIQCMQLSIYPAPSKLPTCLLRTGRQYLHSVAAVYMKQKTWFG